MRQSMGASKNSKHLVNSTQSSVCCVNNARNTGVFLRFSPCIRYALREFPGGFPFSEAPSNRSRTTPRTHAAQVRDRRYAALRNNAA